MTTVTDPELFANADRVKGKVALITGASNGLGRSTALFFGKHGAKVVIGDLDMKGASDVVQEIKSFGGDAVAQKCDVTSWEDQLSLFKFALSTFYRIDVVVPNAGVGEMGELSAVRAQAVNGVPTKPNLKTLEVNLIAVLYTARLALYYLLEDNPRDKDILKALIFVGSMSSIEAIPGGPLYSTSKHGILGCMSSLYGEYKDVIRFGIVCPWFADTAIVPTPLKILMAGIPMTPISRIGAAIFGAATATDPVTNGAIWLLPDDGPVFRLDRAQIHMNEGVYKLINARAAVILGLVSRTQRAARILRDLGRVLGVRSLLPGLGIAAGAFAWKIAPTIRDYITTST